MTEIFVNEDAGRKKLVEILSLHVGHLVIAGKIAGYLTAYIDEVKNGLATGGADAYVEVIHYYIEHVREATEQLGKEESKKLNFPVILSTHIGGLIGLAVATFLGRPHVEYLGTYSLHIHSTNTEEFHAGERMTCALRIVIQEMCTFYTTPNPPPHLDRNPNFHSETSIPSTTTEPVITFPTSVLSTPSAFSSSRITVVARSSASNSPVATVEMPIGSRAENHSHKPFL
ncbi:hypothetical protein Moror_17427 [Moniliophthora roreri MCA 2997]|uniref:Uncharacterized protein n=2 Tax=Moniliophthora roreri TaxID=221103 RepID=V2XYZ0_MONRO|nr:hypothetical protein Moror_17427 [Moniliophthora roreri MCA 2997]